jgi:hypothetical protein
LREREWDRPGGDHLKVPPALGQAELYSSEPISPELVLVSPPELGRRAREQLPNPLADTAASSPRPTRRADDFGWRKLSAAAEDTTDLHEPSRQSHFSWRRVIAAVIVLVALAGAAIVVLPRPWVTLSSSERRSETAATEDIPQTRALGDAARRGPLAPHAAKKLHPQTATARAAIGHATTLHRQRATVAAAATRRPLAASRARPATDRCDGRQRTVPHVVCEAWRIALLGRSHDRAIAWRAGASHVHDGRAATARTDKLVQRGPPSEARPSPLPLVRLALGARHADRFFCCPAC